MSATTSTTPVTPSTARRLHDLTEPIHLVAYGSDECSSAMVELGLRDNYWDGYFAGRAAPLADAPAAVVHAVFYNFAEGEVARHIPRVWDVTTPRDALLARERGCTAALRRTLGSLADSPDVAVAADLAMKAATHPRTDGRALYAGLRVVPVPHDPLARLWHAATLLREHRGDGHNAALVAEGINGTEAHLLHGLWTGTPAREFGRVSHLPSAVLDAVVDGLQARGLLDDAERLTAHGLATKHRVEATTDVLAAPAYDGLSAEERELLEAAVAPISAAVAAVGSH